MPGLSHCESRLEWDHHFSGSHKTRPHRTQMSELGQMNRWKQAWIKHYFFPMRAEVVLCWIWSICANITSSPSCNNIRWQCMRYDPCLTLSLNFHLLFINILSLTQGFPMMMWGWSEDFVVILWYQNEEYWELFLEIYWNVIVALKKFYIYLLYGLLHLAAYSI